MKKTKISSLPRAWQKYQQELANDIGSIGLAGTYVNTLYEACVGNLQVAFNLYVDLVRDLWGPISRSFLEWVWSTVREDQILLFPLRDAGVFFKLERVFPHFGRFVIGKHISRPMVGVDSFGQHDELTEVDEGLLRAYLGPIIDSPESIVLVDTGFWGSLIYQLYQRFGIKLEARFFFSHNDYIPSYMDEMVVPKRLGMTLADSLEIVLSNQIATVRNLKKTGVEVTPETIEHGVVNRELYRATTRGLETCQLPKDPYTLLSTAIDEHFRAQDTGKWTGVLAAPVEEWKKGQQFLDNYPAELQNINPAHLLTRNLNPKRKMVQIPPR